MDFALRDTKIKFSYELSYEILHYGFYSRYSIAHEVLFHALPKQKGKETLNYILCLIHIHLIFFFGCFIYIYGLVII